MYLAVLHLQPGGAPQGYPGGPSPGQPMPGYPGAPATNPSMPGYGSGGPSNPQGPAMPVRCGRCMLWYLTQIELPQHTHLLLC